MKLFRSQFPQLLYLAENHNDFCDLAYGCLECYCELYGIEPAVESFIKCYSDQPFIPKSPDDFCRTMSGRMFSEMSGRFGQDENPECNNLLTYFKEVGKIYSENGNFRNSIEFLPENRELFLKSNLKLVISTAKRYRNLGVPFEDLIGAGNVGLCEAFDKFNSSKNNVRDSVLQSIDESNQETWDFDQVKEVLERFYTYGTVLKGLLKKIPKTGFNSSDEFRLWVSNNIKPAVFATVAFMWIRAYIVIEVNKYAHAVRIPKSAEKEMPSRSRLVSLSEFSEENDDKDMEMCEDDSESIDESLDTKLRNDFFKDIVSELLSILDARERRVLTKRFGIGLPYAMKISEIAEDENMSSSMCGAIYKTTIEKILEHFNKTNNAEKRRQITENLLY